MIGEIRVLAWPWRRGLGAFAAIAAKDAYGGGLCVATSGRIRWPRCRLRVFWKRSKTIRQWASRQGYASAAVIKDSDGRVTVKQSCRFVWLTGTAIGTMICLLAAPIGSALVPPEQEPMKPRGSKVSPHLTIVVDGSNREPFLTAATVAKFLGIAPRTVCLWAACKDIPAIKIGRQWRFRESEVLEWLRNPERAKSNTT